MQVAVIGGSVELLDDLVAGGITPYVVEGREVPEVLPEGVRAVPEPMGLIEALAPPRLYLLDISPGEAVDRIIDTAYATMEPGDIVIDMSGSWWCDTLRRARRMHHRALWYVDAYRLVRRSRPLVVAAGAGEAVALAMPFLKAWAAPGTALHVGASGLAHYAQAVEEAVAASVYHTHNEAAQMLQAWPGEAHHEIVDELWPLPDLGAEPGRAPWVLEDALRLEAALPHLGQAVMLGMAEALDEHRRTAVLPKLGAFGLPDEILD